LKFFEILKNYIKNLFKNLKKSFLKYKKISPSFGLLAFFDAESTGHCVQRRQNHRGGQRGTGECQKIKI
jgi:hypothetical protein